MRTERKYKSVKKTLAGVLTYPKIVQDINDLEKKIDQKIKIKFTFRAKYDQLRKYRTRLHIRQLYRKSRFMPARCGGVPAAGK